MSHSRRWPPCGALLLAATLAACTDSTDLPVTPTPPVEATLAFTMDSSIYVISTAEGATPSLLLSGFIDPSWSPDGRTLAMVATGPPASEGFPPKEALYLADADGSNPRALTDLGDLVGPILWSPDGSTLLFLRSHDIIPRFTHVVRVAASGGSDEVPFDDFQDGVRFEGVPSWSGDGTRVALDHDGTIYVANADGSERIPLTAGSSPRWSPASDDIAYWESGHVHLIRSDGSGERDLGLEATPVAWSPDGSRLAISRFLLETTGTWIVGADGSNPVQIGSADAEVFGAAWSADSKRIAYMESARDDPAPRRWTISVANPDGSGARPLVTSPTVCCLSWRPGPPVTNVVRLGPAPRSVGH